MTEPLPLPSPYYQQNTSLTNTTISLYQEDSFVNKIVIGLTGVVVLLSIATSFFLIYQHWSNYSRPESQRCIVRIVFMVPLYAIYSYMGLLFYDYQVYLAIFRDCYEAYALYMFFVLCTTYLGGWDEMVTTFEQLPKRKCLEPFCCFRVKPGKNLLRWCQRGILQYALIRPLLTLISAFMLLFGVYDDGAWRFDRGWLWMTIINNIGVTLSLYCLVLFYQIAKSDLQPYKPLMKFSVIKGIVFFCYWQSVVLMGFVGLKWIPAYKDWDNGRIGSTLQNLLICYEMLVFSFLHLFAFPYDIYQVGVQTQAPLVHEFEINRGVKGLRKGVKDSINQKDLVDQTFDAYAPGSLKHGQIGPLKKNKFRQPDKDTGDHTLQSIDSDSDNDVELEEESLDILDEDNRRIRKTARR